ncbi:hypothetical protein HanRHA438_Chr13g0618661 [Helianthus annuus]|nr:hypothetical protein HanRHA438_Chr13g0618661 [Helianthus annuus]
MGNDRNGDEVMYGLGVRAADVWGVIPSRSACHRENIQLKSQCEELTSTVVLSSYEPKYQRWKGRGVVPVFNLLHHNISPMSEMKFSSKAF